MIPRSPRPQSDIIKLEDIHLVSPATFCNAPKPEQYASDPVPTLPEFEQLWAAWDLVTRWMIPHEELLSQPIKLRNPCVFYLGHIPNFMDCHLAEATDGVPIEPSYYRSIFERGIDPDVDDPSLCHDHSDIPNSWPPVQEIVTFQKCVRERARSLYRTQAAEVDQKLRQAFWISFEHEGGPDRRRLLVKLYLLTARPSHTSGKLFCTCSYKVIRPSHRLVLDLIS